MPGQPRGTRSPARRWAELLSAAPSTAPEGAAECRPTSLRGHGASERRDRGFSARR